MGTVNDTSWNSAVACKDLKDEPAGVCLSSGAVTTTHRLSCSLLPGLSSSFPPIVTAPLRSVAHFAAVAQL